MINPFELHKQRDIVFNAEPAGQLARAYKVLSGLPDCKVEYGENPDTLRVSYSLANYTLEGLEKALIEQGFELDHSLLHNVGRKIIYYCEDTTCHNMDIPEHPTKHNEREVFMKVYEQKPHGDHDDTPPELRRYK
ncbi:MAG TPA: hypothetical protein VFK88_03770 [Gallionella sp.]|nr:hypothetical protein [Gallionella sp.]